MMWQKFYEILNLLITFGHDLRQYQADLKELQKEVHNLNTTSEEEVRQLREAIQRLAHELQRVRENEAHEREKMELRFEIQKLRSAQSLPAAEIDTLSNEATD